MAGIIKAGGARVERKVSRSAVFNLDDMSDRASGYLESVRRQARKIVEQAEAEAEQIRSRAAEEGRRRALEAAEQAVDKKIEGRLQTLLPALEAGVESIRESKQAWLKQWEAGAVKLAAAIAARVVRRTLERDPEVSLDWLREALELASAGGSIRIRLHPQDYQAMQGQLDLLRDRIGKLASADIIADPEIASAGCVVETEFGVIDQQIETQLARIEEELVF